MHDEFDSKFLEKIFLEVCEGFSTTKIKEETCYIKHPSIQELNVVNSYYDYYFDKVIKMGIPKEKDLMKTLEENGVWSKEDEDKIKKQEIELKGLTKTLGNLFTKREKEPIEKRIKELKKEYKDHAKRRSSVVTNSAEEYADKKSNEKFLFHCLYKDKELKNKKFHEDEFEEINSIELMNLYKEYNSHAEKFSEKNLKQLSISSIFKSVFNLYAKDVTNFFKKHPLDLSFYQINLLNYGKLFVTIFENNKIPENIMDNAEKILKHVDEEKGKKDRVEKISQKANESDGFSYARAKASEMKEMGVEKTGGKDIHSIAQDNGGELSMEDFMKIHKK